MVKDRGDPIALKTALSETETISPLQPFR